MCKGICWQLVEHSNHNIYLVCCIGIDLGIQNYNYCENIPTLRPQVSDTVNVLCSIKFTMCVSVNLRIFLTLILFLHYFMVFMTLQIYCYSKMSYVSNVGMFLLVWLACLLTCCSASSSQDIVPNSNLPTASELHCYTYY